MADLLLINSIKKTQLYLKFSNLLVDFTSSSKFKIPVTNKRTYSM